MILPPSFYHDDDVVGLAAELLGKILISEIGKKRIEGLITETEAYAGEIDRASHAYGGRRTPRTETMYRQGGIAYVYLCYGVHFLLNVVTGKEGVPHGVLIRGLKGVNGPGRVTKSLNVTLKQNRHPVTKQPLWIEDRGVKIPKKEIVATPRIGINYAGEDALLPWRFTAPFLEGDQKLLKKTASPRRSPKRRGCS